MRIHVVAPVTSPELSKREDFIAYARPGTDVEVSILDAGPASIESQFEEAVALPDVLKHVVLAARGGADAIVLDCMGDPGLGAARELTSIPIVGPAQAAMHVAAMLAQNFSIITIGDSVEGIFHDLTRRYGLVDRTVSIRTVDIPVLALSEEGELREKLFEQAIAAFDEDGAHAIVLGCTGMRGWAQRIQDHLEATGRLRIPVIDPVAAAFTLAESLVTLGLAPSKRSYPEPPVKALAGYDELARALGR